MTYSQDEQNNLIAYERIKAKDYGHGDADFLGSSVWVKPTVATPNQFVAGSPYQCIGSIVDFAA